MLDFAGSVVVKADHTTMGVEETRHRKQILKRISVGKMSSLDCFTIVSCGFGTCGVKD